MCIRDRYQRRVRGTPSRKYGTEENQQGTFGLGQGPTRKLQCWTGWRGHVSLASHHHGTARQPLRRRCVLPECSLPNRLPLQATKGTSTPGFLVVAVVAVVALSNETYMILARQSLMTWC
eukprot:TRINITY_DN2995_c0_g1_i1.p1 TRINITY_DN2995_c0_g1~~TRINITY_DN2995_c0_g1_i1.p1  ORF type:complete len:120 (-),score=3.65 TRINITY_DN2995_c0_g1_i1:447-806(-)